MTPAVRDISIEPARAAGVAVVVYVACVSAVVLPFQALWHSNPLRQAFAAVGGWPIALLVVVPAGIAVHELLHATAWAVGGGGWSHVVFGAAPRKLMVYAHYRAPLPARTYLVGALLPGVVMGALPSLLGVVKGWGSVAGWGALFLGFAAGDFIVAWSLRGVSPAALVFDHPTRAGCEVLD
jgi:hypothetical protein